jgi:hypothetical protein
VRDSHETQAKKRADAWLDNEFGDFISAEKKPRKPSTKRKSSHETCASAVEAAVLPWTLQYAPKTEVCAAVLFVFGCLSLERKGWVMVRRICL